MTNGGKVVVVVVVVVTTVVWVAGTKENLPIVLLAGTPCAWLLERGPSPKSDEGAKVGGRRGKGGGNDAKEAVESAIASRASAGAGVGRGGSMS
jgi:hypothetical protein